MSLYKRANQLLDYYSRRSSSNMQMSLTSNSTKTNYLMVLPPVMLENHDQKKELQQQEPRSAPRDKVLITFLSQSNKD